MQHSDVVNLLADGSCHSGEDLARTLGVTRAAVCKQVAKLQSLGLEVDATPGRGYRLGRPIDLLCPDTIRSALDPFCAQKMSRLEVFAEVDSTNRHLLKKEVPASGALAVCLAEFQSSGRGRRGKCWLVPFGGGLCLSVGWLFEETPPDLSALALAVGVVVRRVIVSETGLDVKLKWPNDLVWEDRKLGGILVELAAESQGPCHVIVGVGVNVSVAPQWLDKVTDWAHGAVDLHEATGGHPPARNVFAARLIEALAELFSVYGLTGFAPHHDDFIAADYLRGCQVSVDDAQGEFSGKALAVGADGALMVETDTGIRRIISGEVSVRPAR